MRGVERQFAHALGIEPHARLGHPAGDLDVILPYADSTTLDHWSTVLERIVRARAAPVRRPAASDSVMRTVFLRVYGGLKTSDQLRLVQIA